MRDVVVVDDDGPDGGAAPSAGPAGGRATRGLRRGPRGHPGARHDRPGGLHDADPRRPGRPVRWPVAVVVAAVVVAGAAAVDARSARVEGLPGGLAPLTAPPTTLWRHRASEVHATTAAGDLVVSRHGASGDRVVELVDTRTGATRWTASLPGDPRHVACVPVGDTAARRGGQVACRLLAPAPGSRADDAGPALVSRLVVLDAGTGARVAERPWADRETALTSLGPDLVRVGLLADRHVRVTREHAVTGDARWTVRSPRPVRWAGSSGDRPRTPVPSVQQGLVVVAGGPAAWVLSPGGTVLGEWLPLGSVRTTVDVTVLPDGRYAVTETATTGTVVGETPVGDTAASGSGTGPGLTTNGSVSRSTARDGFVVGGLLRSSLDDGSASDLLLTRSPSGAQVVALDRATGATRWRAPVAAGDAVVLDGRVVVASSDGVTALDASTGRTLWERHLGGLRPRPQVLTDGRVVVVLRWGPAAARRLTALDVADGRERWSVAAPDGTVALQVAQGRLVARTPDELVAVGLDARG